MNKVVLVLLLCTIRTGFGSKKPARSANIGTSGSASDDYGSSEYSGSQEGSSRELYNGGSYGGGSYEASSYGNSFHTGSYDGGNLGGGSYSSGTYGGGRNIGGNQYESPVTGVYNTGAATSWSPISTNGVAKNNHLDLAGQYENTASGLSGVSHFAIPLMGSYASHLLNGNNGASSLANLKVPYSLYGSASSNIANSYSGRTSGLEGDNSYGSSDLSGSGKSSHMSVDFGKGGSSYGSGYGASGGTGLGAFGGGFRLHAPQVHETTKTIPVHKTIKVPVPHPVPHPVAVPVPIKIPQPYAVKIPYPVPVEKTVQVPVEKVVHYPVEKPVPIKVIKKVPYPVPKPYPVPVPVYKVKYVYHSKKHEEHEE